MSGDNPTPPPRHDPRRPATTSRTVAQARVPQPRRDSQGPPRQLAITSTHTGRSRADNIGVALIIGFAIVVILGLIFIK